MRTHIHIIGGLALLALYLASALDGSGIAGAAIFYETPQRSSLNLYNCLKEALTQFIKIKVSIQNYLEG